MGYQEFANAYRAAFRNMNRYTLDQVGSSVYLEEMIKLSDDYPEFLTRFEEEEEKVQNA